MVNTIESGPINPKDPSHILNLVQEKYLLPNNLTFSDLMSEQSFKFLDIDQNGWWDGIACSIDTDGNGVVDKLKIYDNDYNYFEFNDIAGQENQFFDNVNYRLITEKDSKIILRLISINDDGIYGAVGLTQLDSSGYQIASFNIIDSDNNIGYDEIRDLSKSIITLREVEDFQFENLNTESLKNSLFNAHND